MSTNMILFKPNWHVIVHPPKDRVRFRQVILGAFLIVLLPIALAGDCRAKAEQESFEGVSKEELFQMLIQTSFRPDAGDEASNEKENGRLKKWAGELRVILALDDNNQYKSHIEAFYREFSEITGIPHQFVSDGKVNSVVLATRHPYFDTVVTFRELFLPFFQSEKILREYVLERRRKVHSFSELVYDINGDYSIRGSAVALYGSDSNVEQRKILLSKLLLNAVGIDGHVVEGANSVLNFREVELPEREVLTALDKAALRVLYDPALKPGMTFEAAVPIIKSLIRTIE